MTDQPRDQADDPPPAWRTMASAPKVGDLTSRLTAFVEKESKRWVNVGTGKLEYIEVSEAGKLVQEALTILSMPAPAWQTMERIQQRGPNDCGIAALAMACGVSYESVAPLLESGAGAGVNEPDLYEWLRTNGWAWQMVYQNYRRAGEYHRRTPWPPTPFA